MAFFRHYAASPSRASPGPTDKPNHRNQSLWDRAPAREADAALVQAVRGAPFPSFARSHRQTQPPQPIPVGPGASSGSRRRARSGSTRCALPELRPGPQTNSTTAANPCGTGRQLGKQTPRSFRQYAVRPSRASPGPTDKPNHRKQSLWDRAPAREADAALVQAVRGAPFPSFARSHRQTQPPQPIPVGPGASSGSRRCGLSGSTRLPSAPRPYRQTNSLLTLACRHFLHQGRELPARPSP